VDTQYGRSVDCDANENETISANIYTQITFRKGGKDDLTVTFRGFASGQAETEPEA